MNHPNNWSLWESCRLVNQTEVSVLWPDLAVIREGGVAGKVRRKESFFTGARMHRVHLSHDS